MECIDQQELINILKTLNINLTKLLATHTFNRTCDKTRNDGQFQQNYTDGTSAFQQDFNDAPFRQDFNGSAFQQDFNDAPFRQDFKDNAFQQTFNTSTFQSDFHTFGKNKIIGPSFANIPSKPQSETNTARVIEINSLVKTILNMLIYPLILIFIGILNIIVFTNSYITGLDFQTCKNNYLAQMPLTKQYILMTKLGGLL